MGEVYRARDTKLNRDVELKVLPDAFASDPDRLARFQREAQVLASLNHPNIAQIHGLEEADGVRALVLEFVEGPTLAERIKSSRGRSPWTRRYPSRSRSILFFQAVDRTDVARGARSLGSRMPSRIAHWQAATATTASPARISESVAAAAPRRRCFPRGRRLRTRHLCRHPDRADRPTDRE